MRDQRSRLNATHGRGGGNKFPEGKFDRFALQEKALWVKFSPTTFTYDVYNKNSGQVETVTTTWLEYINHFVNGKTPKSWVCSAGPHMADPCYGDAIRNKHYDEVNAVQERTGIRPKGEAPISRSSQFAFAVTVMEKIHKIPQKDKNGAPKKTKAGEPIFNFVPDPVAQLTPGEVYPTTFGHRAHWSMGITHLNQLLNHDDRLRNTCANCAGGLSTKAMLCPDCGESVLTFPESAEGEDLLQLRTNEMQCPHCKYVGVLFPKLECKCGNPEEGRLLSFDVRVKKVPTGEKESVIEIVQVRLPKKDAEVQELVNKPLNLVEIFAPAPLDAQKAMLGNLSEGVNPMATRKGKGKASGLAEPYDSGESEKVTY